MDEKIIPTCRYGHGNLMRQNAGLKENLLYMVSTFPQKLADENPGSYIIYSFAVYKCPKCTYMELHDEV